MTGAPLTANVQAPAPTMVADGQSKTCRQDAIGQVAQPMLPPNDRAGSMPSAALDDTSSSSHNFRMYSFKVVRCSKRYVHDWRTCPYAHPTENARRRDPREFRYFAVPCPEYKKGICLLGDACPYSHGVYECWLHPSKYCTQLCKDGEACRRPVCFFAHSPQDLRQADTQYDPLPEDLERAEAFRMQQQAAAKMQQAINRAAASNLAACHPTLQAVLEAGLQDPEATLLRLAAAQQPPMPIAPQPRFSMDTLLSTNNNGVGGANNNHNNGVGVATSAQGGCASPTSSNSSGDSLQQALSGALANNQQNTSRRSIDSTGSNNNGPRMSNAMARKLGLAPTRDCKRPGVPAAASSRASLDSATRVESLRSFGSMPTNGAFQNAPAMLPAASMLPPLHPGPLDLGGPRFSLDSLAPPMQAPPPAYQDAQQLQQLQVLLTQLQGMQLQPEPQAHDVGAAQWAAMAGPAPMPNGVFGATQQHVAQMLQGGESEYHLPTDLNAILSGGEHQHHHLG